MTRNINDEALKGFVDRLFSIEDEFRSAKLERSDLVKDMKAEIKAKMDETGISVKDVERQVRIRLNEQETRDEAHQLIDDLEVYDLLYGAASRRKGDVEDDDPL